MSKRLVPLPFGAVREILMQNGFQWKSTKGSHHKYKDRFGRTVIVSEHRGKDIPVGTLKEIMEKSGVPRKHFLK